MSRASAVILSGRLNPASLLIMLRTRSLYSHAALLLEDGTVIEASALADRVRRVAHAPAGTGYWERVYPLALPVSDRTEMAAHALEHVGDKYDWQALRGHLFGDHADDPRRFICFELIGHLLGARLPIRKPDEALTGRDLVRALERLC